MQFQKLKTDFLEHLEIEQNRSQKTIENYDHYLTRLVDYAGDIDVKDIDLAEVESAQARAEEALRVAAAEGHDPAEVDNLESTIEFLVAQKLAKGRRR